MPRSLDPQEPLELVLECDRDKTPPPTFLADNMTARQWRQFAEDYEKLFAHATFHEQLGEAFRLLNRYIRGWRDVCSANGHPLDFGEHELQDVLTAGEVMELAGLLYRAARLGYNDKKKSASPPSSSSANSAKSAAAESASTAPPS